MFNDDVLHTPLVLASVGLNECCLATEVVVGWTWGFPLWVTFFDLLDSLLPNAFFLGRFFRPW